MIEISGKVIGNIARVSFEPSRPRFTDAEGDTVLAQTVYGLVHRGGGVSTVEVSLPDNTELLHHKDWVWLCFEITTTGRKTMFTVSSDPAAYRYADLRPVGGPQ